MKILIDGEVFNVIRVIQRQEARRAQIYPGFIQVNVGQGHAPTHAHTLPDKLWPITTAFRTNGHSYAPYRGD